MNKNITLATIKSFVKKNKENLYIKHNSSFDAMQDCVTECKTEFKPINKNNIDTMYKNSMGIGGAWFVLQSRDYFSPYEDAEFRGYEIYNCCGCFVLAVRKYFKLENALESALNTLASKDKIL